MAMDQAGMSEPRAEQRGEPQAVCRAGVWVQDLLALTERAWLTRIDAVRSTGLEKLSHVPEWLLCTFPAWIAGVGGSFRTAEEVFSPEACSASARVSAC